MSNTLYDLLEVNRTAGQETITDAYHRQRAKFQDEGSLDEDALNQLTALREAYQTLSNPERRKRYDLRLEEREAIIVEEAPAFSRTKSLLLVLILCGSGLGYMKYHTAQENARLERERIAAEARLAELAAERQQQEKLEAEKAERQKRVDNYIQYVQREVDLRRGEQVSRNLAYAERQIQQDKAREERQRQYAEQQQRYEAERQLARDKAYLRQLEAENSRSRRF